MLIVSLAMFLTWFVMSPVLTEAWTVACAPLRDGQITVEQAFSRGIVPFRGFMEARVDPEMIATLAEVSPDPQAPPDRLSVLVPAFMRVAGVWNWWAPAPLTKVYDRVGLRES